MFVLDEKLIGVSLDTINLITLTMYSAKSELLNIYDTNFKFDENIIPLATSVLEINPSIMHAKRYSNVDCESFITMKHNLNNSNTTQNPSQSISQYDYPSFLHDIKVNGINMKNIQGYNRKLINTINCVDNMKDEVQYNKKDEVGHIDDEYDLDIEDIFDDDDSDNSDNSDDSYEDDDEKITKTTKLDLLIRMYKLDNKRGEYGQCVLNEEELIIIVWNWDYANFQIIINKLQPEYCQLQMNVYITEDNKIIVSKLANINSIIQKIFKIKNELISRTT